MLFENPTFLWAMACLLPIFFGFYYAYNYLNSIKLDGFFSKLPSTRKRLLSYFLYSIVVALGVIALAKPYIYVTNNKPTYQNIRLLFMVDVSRSMVYAQDIKPNRLEATKQKIRNFYNNLDGNYECAILPFAGDANPYFCPFTSSRNTFLEMLDVLEWRSAPSLGTDITAAFDSISDVFIKEDKIDKSGQNVIILFSDGGKEEALESDRLKLKKLVSTLAKKNFVIYTVGVGGKEPCPLIVTDDDGKLVTYLKVNNKIQYSQMDPAILQNIAELGGGTYLDISEELDLKSTLIKFRKEIYNSNLDKFYLQSPIFAIMVCLICLCLAFNRR